MNLGMSFVPVGVLLERACRLDNGDVVTRPRQKLQSGGKILIRESAGNGKRWKTAKIPDAAKRIRKDEAGFQIEFQRRGCDGLRSGHEHVERFEQRVHCFLKNFSYFQRLQVVCGGILL